MKNKDGELALKRYEILEPYISKNKTLKNLCEDSDISYSTLKRWASSYKKHGLDGLKKTERSDKDTYRALTDETFDYIKTLYKEDPNLKILDYYNKIISFIKDIGAKSVSYDTVYRVINQLDPFIKDCLDENLQQIKSLNEVFELEYCQIDYFILDERDDTLKKPYIYIVYDSYSEIISSFLLSFDKINLQESLSLLREAIYSRKSGDTHRKPKEFVINNLKFNEKDYLTSLKKQLGISVSFSLGVENKLQDFFDVYNNHYLKVIFFTLVNDLNLRSLSNLTKKYIDKNFNKFKNDDISEANSKLKKIHSENDLDLLLTLYPSKRKVKDGAIRFQNLLYEHPMLYQYEDIELEVRYNPFDLSKIKVYDFGFYLCQLNSEILGNFPISNYDFSIIKKTIKTKYADSTISLKQYALEFKELVQIKCKE